MRQRILTALIGIPIVLGILFVPNPWPLVALLVLVGVVAIRELGAMLENRRVTVASALIWAIAVGWAVLESMRSGGDLRSIAPVIACCFATWALTIFSSPQSMVRKLLLPVWIIGPLGILIWQHSTAIGNAPTLNFAILLMLTVWAGDTAAIFAGRAIGGPKIAPGISPNKTWSGSVANLLACVAISVGIGIWSGIDWRFTAWFGGIVGVFGQAGDLFQSHLKRQQGVKDSGSLLPGHGGILDRIDSLLFAAPTTALYIHLFIVR